MPLNLRSEWRWLLALILFAGILRMWHLVTTEVTARDSIHFIRIAWQLENEPWKEVLSKATQHPGFPFATLGMSHLVRPILANDLPLAMQVSAQLVSVLASLLIIFPLYGLARAVFAPPGASLGVLLVQFLPVTARLFPDALSEATFLLFAFGSIWSFGFAINTERRSFLAIAGFTAALAYLTRPEGGLVFLSCLAVGFYLLFIKRVWIVNQGAAGAVGGMMLLVLGFMVPAVPYAVTIGRLTSKPTATRILQANPVEASASVQTPLFKDGPTSGPLWAAWYDFEKDGKPGLAWGIWATTGMVVRGLLFAFWLPAFLGIWKFRHKLITDPACLAQTCVGLGVFLALIRVASNLGYVSDRHLVLIVVPSLLIAGGYITDWAYKIWAHPSQFSLNRSRLKLERFCFVCLAFTAFVAAAKLTLEPLHLNRAGFKVAGHWIRDNGMPGDEVIDPYQWAHYYAGRVFLENSKIAQVRSNPPARWVVLEKGKSKHVRLNLPEEQSLISQGAELVFETNEKRQSNDSGDSRKLVVYRLPISVPAPVK